MTKPKKRLFRNLVLKRDEKKSLGAKRYKKRRGKMNRDGGLVLQLAGPASMPAKSVGTVADPTEKTGAFKGPPLSRKVQFLPYLFCQAFGNPISPGVGLVMEAGFGRGVHDHFGRLSLLFGREMG